MSARQFHLGDILSVTTGRLVSPNHVSGVHGLLDFMTNDSLFTHQLPRASEECKPELLRQHPDLALVEPPDFRDEGHVWAWLAEQVARFGTTREVSPLPPADHTRIDPLAEFALHWPNTPVVAVDDLGETP